MTPETTIVFVILIASLILFVTERVRVDIVALLVLLALLLTSVLTVDEAFAGFASPAVITVWSVFMISGALVRTGLVDIITRNLLRIADDSETRLLLLMMLIVAVLSAFMNNIGAVAVMMPVVIGVGRQMKISPSRLLMPLAFVALLGGNITLIGTPPNILAVELMEDAGITGFGFFDFLPTGLLVSGIGILYMMTIGRRLLPERQDQGELAEKYQVRDFITEVRVSENSPLIGHPVSQAGLDEQNDVTLIYVRSANGDLYGPLRKRLIQAEDTILLEGSAEDIVAACQQYKLQTVQDWTADKWHPETYPDEFHLAEVTLTPNSRLANKTLRQIDFTRRYGLSVLALRKGGRPVRRHHLADQRIRFGDSLLVQGETYRLERLVNEPNLLVLERPTIEFRRTQKAYIAGAILVGMLVISALGIVHVSALLLSAAVLMVLSGAITMDEAYRYVDWQSVFLIAGMLPLGMAMEKTGAAQLLAEQTVNFAGGYGPLAVMALIFILTSLLTNVISNAAATVLIVPIVIDIALSLGIAPQAFIMTTVLAASNSFLTPIGHQVNVLILSTGRYRFVDYTRVGFGLTILVFVTVMLVVPLIWQF